MVEPKFDQQDREPDFEAPAVSAEQALEAPTPPRPKLSRLALAFSGVAIALSIGVAAGAFYLHENAQREIIRLSTEIAQLRLSLDLYARGNASGGSDLLTSLTTRLETLEKDFAERPAATATSPTTLPAIPLTTPSAPTIAATDDCLPPGMRLLVTTGDSYPICGQPVTIEVGTVDNGYIMLTDGTAVPAGVAVPLAGTSCTLTVTSNGDEALTGYAEIRASC